MRLKKYIILTLFFLALLWDIARTHVKKPTNVSQGKAENGTT